MPLTRGAREDIRDEIERMSELGGSVIDTAASYGDSEALIGDALSSLGSRDKLFLATKLVRTGFGVTGADSLERSMQRLKTAPRCSRRQPIVSCRRGRRTSM
jgi:aryl-alcohol dehydrogenase-like predicted oxidoreductase